MDKDKLVAALRFYNMALDHKKFAKAKEAFQQAHKLDLIKTYNDAIRFIEGSNECDSRK